MRSIVSPSFSGLQALHAAVCAVHSDHQAVTDVRGGTHGTHDGGLEQSLAGNGGMAVQAGLLHHQSGGVAHIVQHLVAGGRHHQHHAGLELGADLVQRAADAGLAGSAGQVGAPEKTIFLLVSEAPEMILSTILSRTQRFNIRKIDEASMANALQQKYGVQPADSQTIAHLANGNFIKALETIHLNEENELFFNLFVSLMRLSYQRKIREMKQWSEQLAAMGRERQKNFLEYCQRMIRENFIYNLHRKEMNYMTLPEQNFATRFAPFVNERNVMGIMDELSEAQVHIEQNVNARMVFFDFSLKMIVLLKQ